MTKLRDTAARERIRTDTGSTLFVEAGAGSGKTRSLVNRCVTLVLNDGVPLSAIAAVTFTEKAGAELRDKLRAQFEAAWRNETGDRSQRAAKALDDLDSAAIGTLHSFAQRILTEHPIEAGLPPMVEVLDEVASSVVFDERWAEQRVRLLDDDDIAEALLLALSAGVTLDHLRSLSRAFNNDWDLVADRVLAAEPPAPVELPDLRRIVERATALAEQLEHCSEPTDRFLPKLTGMVAWGRRLDAAVDAGSRLEVLREVADLRWGVGNIGNWRVPIRGLRTLCKDLQQEAADLSNKVLDATLDSLKYWVAREVLAAAEARRGAGRLEFHDLLVLARDLLRTRADVRAVLQQRYSRLLLDEFQDTDPIQIELAVRIAAGAAGGADDWRDVDVPKGSLFVVGDPKQSIYRFRRADIATYLQAQERIGATGRGETVSLTTNFRTVPPVLDWVNAVFGKLITYAENAQPSYQALDEDREAHTDGPAVLVLGSQGHEGKLNAASLRMHEASDVAAVVRAALDEPWQVYDEKRAHWRPVRPADIAVLLPARTSLPFLEEAFDRAGVSYRAESSSLVYQGSEVRDLLAAARAVADPSDPLALVTALRSPLFGCGDDDLWTWKRDGGGFNLLAPVAESLAGHPVAVAMSYLRGLHNRSRWMTPSELLTAVVADRRMLEVAATGPRSRDGWRRLRFVVDQARAWSEVEHGGLRAYLAWADRQGEETARVAEAVLPERDGDAVRVMTVHAAKGLEFPIVVLSGMTSQPRRSSGVQVLWPQGGGCEVRLTRTVQTGDFEAQKPLDEQMDDYERRRLLYVATTRARDHLVVSLHRCADAKIQSSAKILADAGADTAAGAHGFSGEPPVAAATARGSSPDPPDYAAWLAELEGVREASKRPSAFSASGLEGTEPAVALDPQVVEIAGKAKGKRNLEEPPWAKGRYGTSLGRAVHGVLQVVDLATGDRLDDAVAAQCVAEGVLEHIDVVRAMVRRALDSAVVRRAAAREHWREAYVGIVRDDGTVHEGFVDLIYREDDGSLVVVDYKTDAVPQAAVAVRTAYYQPQLDAYKEMLEAATGATARSTLLFTGTHTG